MLWIAWMPSISEVITTLNCRSSSDISSEASLGTWTDYWYSSRDRCLRITLYHHPKGPSNHQVHWAWKIHDKAVQTSASTSSTVFLSRVDHTWVNWASSLTLWQNHLEPKAIIVAPSKSKTRLEEESAIAGPTTLLNTEGGGWSEGLAKSWKHSSVGLLHSEWMDSFTFF